MSNLTTKFYTLKNKIASYFGFDIQEDFGDDEYVVAKKMYNAMAEYSNGMTRCINAAADLEALGAHNLFRCGTSWCDAQLHVHKIETLTEMAELVEEEIGVMEESSVGYRVGFHWRNVDYYVFMKPEEFKAWKGETV